MDQRQFVEALLQTYGTVTALELLQFMGFSALGDNTTHMTIAGIAAATWFGQNTLPMYDLLPTGAARIAFLVGAVGVGAEVVAMARRNRRPILADITNRA